MDDKKPNIIVIMTDQQRADMWGVRDTQFEEQFEALGGFVHH